MGAEPDSKLAWIDAYLGYLRTERKLSGHTTAAYARDLQELPRCRTATTGRRSIIS